MNNTKKDILNIAIYLRKSREDLELEKTGAGETLAKHRAALLKIANEYSYNIVNTYEDLVSGESLESRPQVLSLLEDVRRNMYDAVLCMDIDRLGRGNMQEQGLILDTFKNSKTCIITPQKIYDLSDEFDEEYSEFEAFMARKELKIIKRRFQRGKTQCLEQGQWIGAYAPYGYEKVTNGKLKTLKIVPEQAEIVKLVFDLYTTGNMGGGMIANHLNELGQRTIGDIHWTPAAVRVIIRNPAYIGKISWCKFKHLGKKANGKAKRERVHIDNWLLFDGLHEPIIDIETWEKSQEIIKNRYHSPYNKGKPTTNSLCGLVLCGLCGKKMTRRPYPRGEAHLICTTFHCDCKSNGIQAVEDRVLDFLKKWIFTYRTNIKNNKSEADKSQIFLTQVSELEFKLNTLQQQKIKIHSLLEQDIYDQDTYLDRINAVIKEIHSVIAEIERNKQEYKKLNLVDHNKTVAKYESILELYATIESPSEKNMLLKTIIESITYMKTKDKKKNEFEIFVTYKP